MIKTTVYDFRLTQIKLHLAAQLFLALQELVEFPGISEGLRLGNGPLKTAAGGLLLLQAQSAQTLVYRLPGEGRVLGRQRSRFQEISLEVIFDLIPQIWDADFSVKFPQLQKLREDPLGDQPLKEIRFEAREQFRGRLGIERSL